MAAIAHGQASPPASSSKKKSIKTHRTTASVAHSTKTSASQRRSTVRDGKGTPGRVRSAGSKTHTRHRASRKAASWRTRGQQKPDAERATQIQTALIREHYMTGAPTGVWDPATQQAMQHYQADHRWQTKTTPDARALIQLGLGPDQKHLLNPETAATSSPTITSSPVAPASAPVIDPPHPAGAPANSAGATSNDQSQR